MVTIFFKVEYLENGASSGHCYYSTLSGKHT